METFNPALYNFEMIELQTTAAKNSYSFPDIPNLQQLDGSIVRIAALNIYTVATIAKTPVNGWALMNATAFKDAFLQLYTLDNEFPYNNIPFIEFCSTSSNGFVRQLANPRIVWSKSKVVFSQTGNITANEAICIGVYYRRSSN